LDWFGRSGRKYESSCVAQRAGQPCVERVIGKHNNPRRRSVFRQPANQLDAVDFRHDDVENNDSGVEGI
jgi:hypothetical protein